MSADASGGPADMQAVAAALHSHGEDVSLYAGMLLDTLAGALPERMITVERSGGGLLRKKPRGITAVTITVNDRRFFLSRKHVGAKPLARVEHVVRGIVLSNDELPVTQWTDQLAQELADAARDDGGVAAAIEQLVRGA